MILQVHALFRNVLNDALFPPFTRSDPDGNNLPHERTTDMDGDVYITYTPRQVGE